MSGRRAVVEPGFSLIELLVVVAVIALLAAILLPALSEARGSAKRAVCGSNLRQLGVAIHAYAAEYGGLIPRGPDPADEFDFASNQLATNQLWIGDGAGGFPTPHPFEYNGLGRLLVTTCPQAAACFCPADDQHLPLAEVPRVGTAADAYGSYIYRQLDQLPAEAARGVLDQMGTNQVGAGRVRVEALALDTNALGPGLYYQTNHGARRVNILFRDGSVRNFANLRDCLALAAAVFADPAGIPAAVDQLLTNADYAYATGRPADAPRLVPAP